MDMNLYLQGGGTRLAAHLGVLQAVEEQGGQVHAWAGASAGSILAGLLACGYSRDETMELMLETDFRQFLDFRPWGLLRNYGLYAGRRMEAWLEEVYEGRRFGDLQVPLAVVCTDIMTGSPRLFTTSETPEVKVSTAVRCSIGIPGFFAIRRVEREILVDGALARADESTLFPDPHLPYLTVRLTRDPNARGPVFESFGLFTYVQQVATMLLDAADDSRLPFDQWKRTLLVRTTVPSSVDFGVARETKTLLYQTGYEQARLYLDLKHLTAGPALPAGNC